MPAAVNLVLKNAAAADKTFELLQPAAGDNSVAKWALKEGTISSVFPFVTASARQTGNASRLMQGKLRIPSSYTDTVTGLTKVGSGFEFNFTATVPEDYPEALKNDAIAFAKNLIANAVMQACIRDGLPAT
jgi:hypothetical protein